MIEMAYLAAAMTQYRTRQQEMGAKEFLEGILYAPHHAKIATMSSLIFVYALDGGLFNGITHYAHKIISPSTYPCNLCAVTNSMLGTKREWAKFIRELGITTEFLHRDEFIDAHPNAQQNSFPAVFRSSGNDDLQVVVTSSEINECNELSALISLVSDRVKTSQTMAANASPSI